MKYYIESMRKILSCLKWKEGRLTGLVTLAQKLRSNSRCWRKIEGTGGGEGRRKKLLDDFEEWRKYWKLKEEVQYCTISVSRFGRGYGLVVRLATCLRWWWWWWRRHDHVRIGCRLSSNLESAITLPGEWFRCTPTLTARANNAEWSF